jgi:translocation and assembly module TamA
MTLLLFADTDGVEYKVKLKGADDNTVKKAIKESSRTVAMRKRLPSTVGQLRRRVEKDIPLIETILESRGFYDGQVEIEIDSERDPMRVTIWVEQGPQYRFRSIQIDYLGEPDERLDGIKPILKENRKAVAARVFDEQQRIIKLMKRRGYPFARLSRRAVEVDRENKVVDLELEFDPGQLSFFGPVQVDGLTDIPEKYIQRQVPWKEGRRYDSQLVYDFETRLLGTGQFGTARVEPREAASGTNAIPMLISLRERSPRTIRFGVNYSDIGPGGKLYWEHRNIFGGGERFDTSISVTPIELLWDARLTRAGFLGGNQSLVLDIEAKQETPDAYDAKSANTSAMVLRNFTPRILGGLGLGYTYSQVEQFGIEDRFDYVFFPLQVDFDYRDDRLNPQRGVQLFGITSWNQDVNDNNSYLKSFVEGRDYMMLWQRFQVSSALRLSLGSIDGTSVDQVPADERFYAGGGGSIRGYEYQSVGPKLDGTPTGGDKLVEFSAELRMQPGARLGYVIFLDGGTVYNGALDNELNRSLRYGAGVGLRWFSNIGPFRVDLAYPLNADDTQKESVQFYISLGQAF